MYNFNPYQFNPYQSAYTPQNYQQPQQQPQQQPVDDRIFVANAAAADAYLVAPNGFVRLWDSSKPFFYEKAADASGRQFPIAVYRYEKAENQRDNQNPVQDYSERLNAIEAKIAALEAREQKHDEH